MLKINIKVNLHAIPLVKFNFYVYFCTQNKIQWKETYS